MMYDFNRLFNYNCSADYFPVQAGVATFINKKPRLCGVQGSNAA